MQTSEIWSTSTWLCINQRMTIFFYVYILFIVLLYIFLNIMFNIVLIYLLLKLIIYFKIYTGMSILDLLVFLSFFN